MIGAFVAAGVAGGLAATTGSFVTTRPLLAVGTGLATRGGLVATGADLGVALITGGRTADCALWVEAGRTADWVLVATGDAAKALGLGAGVPPSNALPSAPTAKKAPTPVTTLCRRAQATAVGMAEAWGVVNAYS